MNTHGGGIPSTEVHTTPYDGATAQPGAPTSLMATPGNRQVTLRWDAPSTIGGSAITGYEYQQSSSRGTFGDTWTEVSGGESIRQVVVSNLTGATMYYFRVRAVNTDGEGIPSTEVSATSYDGLTPEPGPPTDLTAATGDRQVKLSWGSPNAIGASEITGYEYQQSSISGTFDDTWTEVSGGENAREVTVSVPTNGATYYFQVRAMNANGVGYPSEMSVTIPAAPNLLICSNSETTDDALPGAGAVDDPFVLCSSAHLSLIGKTGVDTGYTLSANYVMGQDIDLNHVSFTPIAGAFTGTFNGRNKRIMNLDINTSGNAALFLDLDSGGVIKNLGIEGFDVVGSGKMGPLVATNSGTITHCYAVDSDDSIDVSGGSSGDYIGGLVGYQDGGDITSSYATGEVHGLGGHDYIGGLVGYNKGDSSVTSSYATGYFHGNGGNDNVGGLVGFQIDGSITSSYATGSPSGGDGNDNVGGLVGYQTRGTVTSSYATGDSLGGSHNDYVGGLVGYHYYDSKITSSYATGHPIGNNGGDYVGRLIANRYNKGVVISSYGFGTPSDGSVNTDGGPPSGVSSASDLTQTNSGWSSDTWDFGDASQIPVLK